MRIFPSDNPTTTAWKQCDVLAKHAVQSQPPRTKALTGAPRRATISPPAVKATPYCVALHIFERRKRPYSNWDGHEHVTVHSLENSTPSEVMTTPRRMRVPVSFLASYLGGWIIFLSCTLLGWLVGCLAWHFTQGTLPIGDKLRV
jgi:hypothetical protein